MLLLWLLADWAPVTNYLTELFFTILITGVTYFVAHILFSRVVISSQGLLQAAKNLKEANPYTTSSAIVMREEDLQGWASMGLFRGIFYIAHAEQHKMDHHIVMTLNVYTLRWNAERLRSILSDLDDAVYTAERSSHGGGDEGGGDYLKLLYVPDLILHQETQSKVDTVLAQFEARYHRFKQPQSIGFLLTGAPGTGKSSLPKYIAQHMNRLCVVNSIYSVMDPFGVNVHFMRVSGQTAAECAAKTAALYHTSVRIVVFEDIDRVDFTKGLSALLSAVDYIRQSAYFSIVIFTTNSMNLPEPLIRSGRIDEVVMFHLLDRDMTYRMAMAVWASQESDPAFEELLTFMEGRAPSMMDHLCKMCVTPAQALESAKKMVEDRAFAESYFEKSKPVPAKGMAGRLRVGKRASEPVAEDLAVSPE